MVTEGVGRVQVFHCQWASTCRGERDVFSNGRFNSEGICTDNSDGLCCARCKSGFYLKDGGCSSCQGATGAHPLIGIAVSVVTVLLTSLTMYHQSMFPPNPDAITLGSFFSFWQAIAVAGSFSYEYRGNSAHMMNLASLIEFNPESVNAPTSCISGTHFSQRFASKLSTPLLFLLGFAVLFFINKVFRKALGVWGINTASPLDYVPPTGCRRKALSMLEAYTRRTPSGIPMQTRVQWYWSVQIPDVVNVVVRTQNALFITLTNIATDLFQSLKHPDGQYTVRDFTDVLFYSEEWYAALPVSLAALACYSIGFLGFVIYLNAVAPRRFSRCASFRRRFRSLWAKFDPQAWWFCTVQGVYGLSISLISATTEHVSSQITMYVAMNIVYVLKVVHACPWKFRLNHYVDICFKLGTAFFVLFLQLQDGSIELMDICFFSSVILPTVIAACLAIHSMWFRKVAKVTSSRVRANFAQRFVDLVSIARTKTVLELRAQVLLLLDNDIHCLDAALDILQFMLLGLQPQSVSRWRLSPLPFDVATAGRLEGELQVRALADPHDARHLIRRLKEQFSIGQGSGLARMGKIRSSQFTGKSSNLTKVFNELKASPADATIDENAFVEGLYNSYGNTDDVDGFSREELARIYRYIDVDQGHSLDVIEFVSAFSNVVEPVCSPGASSDVGDNLRHPPVTPECVVYSI